MVGVLQDLAGVGSGVSLGLVARWALVARKEFLLKKEIVASGEKQGTITSSRLPAEKD